MMLTAANSRPILALQYREEFDGVVQLTEAKGVPGYETVESIDKTADGYTVNRLGLEFKVPRKRVLSGYVLHWVQV